MQNSHHKINSFFIVILALISVLIISCHTEKVDNTSQFLKEYVKDNGTLIAAHRGYAEIAPENTISAFKAALNVGANACEFDVHQSKDGVLVVIHDDSVDRTTDGFGKVNQLNYDYLSTLDAGSWKDPKYKGEKIPTLFETLTFLKENNMIAVLEIKVSTIVDDVIDMLYKTEMNENTIIISFSKSAISKVMKTDSKIPALLLIKDKSCMSGTSDDKANAIINKAEKIGTKYVGPFSFQLEKLDSALVDQANYDLKKSIDPGVLPLALDKETIEKLHESGYFIDAWTVDNEENIRDLINSNVDILTTNYLERALYIKSESL